MSRFLLISLSFLVCLNLSCVTTKKDVDMNLAKFRNNESAVYPVMVYNPKVIRNIGTAFRIKYKDKFYLITAGHVCSAFTENPGMLFMIQSRNNQYTINNSHSLSNDDICLVSSIGYQESSYLELDSSEIKIGDELFTIGYPGHPENEFKGPIKIFEYGRLIGYDKVLGENMIGYSLYEKSLPIFARQVLPGQSGSPIFNKQGKVVGILVLQNEQGFALFTPITNLIKFLDESK